MTQTHAVFEGILEVKEFIDLFSEVKEAGLGPTLWRLVPQEVDEAGYPGLVEDISPLEVGHLFALLQEKPECTVEEADELISSVKDVCRNVPYTKTTNLDVIGLANRTGL